MSLHDAFLMYAGGIDSNRNVDHGLPSRTDIDMPVLCHTGVMHYMSVLLGPYRGIFIDECCCVRGF